MIERILTKKVCIKYVACLINYDASGKPERVRLRLLS